MKDKLEFNQSLEQYLMENIKVMVECDLEEKVKEFPYTYAVNNLLNYLKIHHNIGFNENMISEFLLDKMVDEITNNITK